MTRTWAARLAVVLATGSLLAAAWQAVPGPAGVAGAQLFPTTSTESEPTTAAPTTPPTTVPPTEPPTTTPAPTEPPTTARPTTTRPRATTTTTTRPAPTTTLFVIPPPATTIPPATLPLPPAPDPPSDDLNWAARLSALGFAAAAAVFVGRLVAVRLGWLDGTQA